MPPRMFIAALFIVFPNCKQHRCPSTREWINKYYCGLATTQQSKEMNYEPITHEMTDQDLKTKC